MRQQELRDLLSADGIVVLADHELDYWDGGEDQVLGILTNASDLSSTSQELSVAGTTWPEQYHLSKQRSNIVRPLNLPPDARVLEIGAGCGAVTRYLGEQCAEVDALEPVPGRARAARARTRELDNVTVYVGMLEDLPDEAVYDLIVVIGVLEYVGGGTANPAPYRAFLEGIERRLKPGGNLVLAIENRLGVKYLAGAPEDHTGHAFDSLEQYPDGTPARTFARAELEALFVGAGLAPRTFLAFPDYKVTRAVIAADVPGTPSQLLRHLPNFPSPDWSGERSWTVDEGRLWTTIVEAGLAHEFPNSFLTIGTKAGATEIDLWAPNRAATYFATGRTTALCARIDVEIDPARAVQFARRPLVEHLEPVAENVRVHHRDSTFIEGTHLIELLAAPGAGDGEMKALLKQWIQLIDARLALDPTSTARHWDALPQNVIVKPDGDFHIIDDEWEYDDVTRDDIVARGILLAGLALAEQTPPRCWPGCSTTRDVVTHLGVLANLPSGWITPAIAREAIFQEIVHGAAQTEDERAAEIDDRAQGFEDQLATLLAFQRLGADRTWSARRHRQALDDFEQSLDAMNVERHRLLDIETDLSERLDAAHREIDAMRNNWSWRLTAPIRKLRGQG